MLNFLVIFFVSSAGVVVCAADLKSNLVQGVYQGHVQLTTFDQSHRKVADQASQCEVWLDKGKFMDYKGGIAIIVKDCLHGNTEFFNIAVFYFNLDGTVSGISPLKSLNIVKSSHGADFFDYEIQNIHSSWADIYQSKIKIISTTSIELSSIHTVYEKGVPIEVENWNATLTYKTGL